MTDPSEPGKSGYTSVNGLQMYYEMYGAGQPLALLHGAFSATGTSFGKLLPCTSHVSLVNRADLLIPMITSFLDAPMPETDAR